MSSSNRIAAAVGIADVILLALCLFLYFGQDRKAPVISFGENSSSYTEGMDQEALMGGVIALDAEDGDVTDSLVIEKISDTAKGEVIVTYVALDHSNNVAKASRMFRAEAGGGQDKNAEAGTGQAPEDGTADGTGTEGEAAAGEGAEGETGAGGADDSDNGAEDGAGREEEETDEERENEQEPVNEPPVLLLNTEVLNVPAGTEGADWNACIDRLTDDTDLREALYAGLTVEGTVDYATPGDYPVVLYTTDTQGKQSEHRELIVRVE